METSTTYNAYAKTILARVQGALGLSSPLSMSRPGYPTIYCRLSFFVFALTVQSFTSGDCLMQED